MSKTRCCRSCCVSDPNSPSHLSSTPFRRGPWCKAHGIRVFPNIMPWTQHSPNEFKPIAGRRLGCGVLLFRSMHTTSKDDWCAALGQGSYAYSTSGLRGSTKTSSLKLSRGGMSRDRFKRRSMPRLNRGVAQNWRVWARAVRVHLRSCIGCTRITRCL